MRCKIQPRVSNANVKAKAAVRNAAEDVSASRPRSDRFGGWQGHKRLAGLEASSVHLTLLQCR